MLQGVHELYELEETPEFWADHEPRLNQLVFIGENQLYEDRLQVVLDIKTQCLYRTLCKMLND